MNCRRLCNLPTTIFASVFRDLITKLFGRPQWHFIILTGPTIIYAPLCRNPLPSAIMGPENPKKLDVNLRATPPKTVCRRLISCLAQLLCRRSWHPIHLICRSLPIDTVVIGAFDYLSRQNRFTAVYAGDFGSIIVENESDMWAVPCARMPEIWVFCSFKLFLRRSVGNRPICRDTRAHNCSFLLPSYLSDSTRLDEVNAMHSLIVFNLNFWIFHHFVFLLLHFLVVVRLCLRMIWVMAGRLMAMAIDK